MNDRSSIEKGSLMKMLTRTALALFGGASALVLAGLVVLAVVVVIAVLFTPMLPPQTSAPVTLAPPAAGVAGPEHAARLAGCISGLDC